MKQNLAVETPSVTQNGDNSVNVARDNNGTINQTIIVSPTPFVRQPLGFLKPNPHLKRTIVVDKEQNSSTKYGSSSEDFISTISKQRHIVILGDAGMGKTTELEYLAHEISEQGNYDIIFRRLQNYTDNSKFLNEYSFTPEQEERVVLFLDGLDEVNISVAKNTIEIFCQEHPMIKIIVGCRSNAYSETLKGFSTYSLSALSPEEIGRYIDEKLNVHSTTFWKYWTNKYPWDSYQIIRNPFFLVRICEYFEDNNNTPPESLGELFEHLIQKSLELRLKDTATYGSGFKEALRLAYRKNLEKLAFIMTCMGENNISNTDLEKIITTQNEKDLLLQNSSLIELDGNRWRFTHNNFKEYLAAAALANSNSLQGVKEAISSGPNFGKFMWSWTNTISFLFSILDNPDHSIKKNLINWFCHSNIDALIKIGSFEKEKISLPDRTRILQLAFENAKKEEMIIGSHQYRFWELADFGKSTDTLTYLMEQLKSSQSIIAKTNAISLLSCFSPSHVPTDIKSVLYTQLRSIINDTRFVQTAIRHYATQTIIQLFDDITAEDAANIINLLFDSRDAQERTSAYNLIKKCNLQMFFMKRLLVREGELNDPTWRNGENRLVDESWALEHTFSEVDESTMLCFFQNLKTIAPDYWQLEKKIIESVLTQNKNTNISTTTADTIFAVAKEYFAEWISHTSFINSIYVIDFIRQIGKADNFFTFCLKESRYLNVSSYFFTEELITYLIHEYQTGTFSYEEVCEYLLYLKANQNEHLNKLVEQLNDLAIEQFTIPNLTYKNREEDKIELLIREKEFYFNRELYFSAIKSIFKDAKKERFNKNEIFDIKPHKDINYLYTYPISLMQVINDNPGLTQDDLIALLNNDYFFMRGLKSFLSNKEADFVTYPQADLTEAEKAIVKVWGEKHIHNPNFNLLNNITNGDVLWTWFTIKYKILSYPKEIYFQMATSKLINYSNFDIFEFCISNQLIPARVLENHVLNVLNSNDELSEMVIDKLLNFIKKHQIVEAVGAIQRLIHGQYDEGLKQHATKTLIKLQVDDDTLLHLFKGLPQKGVSSVENTLINHFLEKAPSINSNFEFFLQNKFECAKTEELKVKYAMSLLELSNLPALKYLVDYTKKIKKTPFGKNYGWRKIHFENIDGIGLLLALFESGEELNASTDDTDNNMLAAQSMITHLAQIQNGIHFEKVINSIRKKIKVNSCIAKLPTFVKSKLRHSSSNTILNLKYLVKTLEFEHYQKEHITIESALRKFNNL